MLRRTFLMGATTALVATAGCLTGSSISGDSREEPALAENRPDAVYVPTHRDGMEMVGGGDAGDLRVGLMYSYPHEFWVVEQDGDEFVTSPTGVEDGDAVHLMATPFHEPTGTVIPSSGLSVEITQDGSLVSQEILYPMLSQQMGFHYGANFPLAGDGSYEVNVSVGGVNSEQFGDFEGLFDEPAEASVSFDYRETARNEIDFERFNDRAGKRGALEPMEMDKVPTGRAPEQLPGTALGEAASGDATVLAAAVEAARFDGTRVGVSPRTPYNALVIPGMGLEATLTSADGSERFDGRLRPALDPELGFHYGTTVDELESGDELRVSVTTPPQVARHEGYETTFLEMNEMGFTAP